VLNLRIVVIILGKYKKNMGITEKFFQMKRKIPRQFHQMPQAAANLAKTKMQKSFR